MVLMSLSLLPPASTLPPEPLEVVVVPEITKLADFYYVASNPLGLFETSAKVDNC